MPPFYALCYIIKITADETDGGTPFTTDGTLTMSAENVLGVANPIRSIVTQAEFDFLSEEQKNKGAYFIDDGVTSQSCRLYRTGDWTVLKFDNGYIELIYNHPDTVTIPISEWSAYGVFQTTGYLIPYTNYPEKLSEYFGEEVVIKYASFGECEGVKHLDELEERM